jgi:hypothetical protein
LFDREVVKGLSGVVQFGGVVSWILAMESLSSLNPHL